MNLRPATFSVFALLPLALLVSGCGIGPQTTATLTSPAVAGTLLGGRNPISGATLSIYIVGNSGYGSAATQVGSSVTSTPGGGFQFPAGTLSACATSTPNAPIYLLSVAGNAGGGTSNSAAVLGASLGTCGTPVPNLNVNEITTTALAFAMSHFFGTPDTFGGPNSTGTYAPYAFGLGLAAAHTVPALVNPASGTVMPGSSSITLDSAKLYSIGNSLAACVNSTGPNSSNCNRLFTDTTPPGSTTLPTDILQAAVNMALYPYQNVSDIYGIASANAAPYVGLGTTPTDWTLGVSYTSAAFGLQLNAQTLTTIDIDAVGKVWFPSNVTGAIGVGNFDPSVEAFNGPYTVAGMVHPQQVAIDDTSEIWVNDNASSALYGFSAAGSSGPPPRTFTLANTVSTALTVDEENNVVVAIENTSTGAFSIATENSGTYAPLGARTAAEYIQSITSDTANSNAISLINMSAPSTNVNYVSTSGSFQSVLSSIPDNPGQIIFSGSDYILALPQSGPTLQHDSICQFTTQKCYPLTSTQALSPYGIAIDGDGTLWMADAANTLNADSSSNKAYAGAMAVPLLTTGQPTYVGSASTVANHPYFRGTGLGALAPMPYGIAIDNSGNVWLSNVGCIITAPATSCTPGSFVLTELVGAAAPTITPVSTTVIGNTGPGNRP